jgi:hypothetical protein
MGRTPIRAKLVLDAGARSKLEAIAKSRTEGQARIERAKVLLVYREVQVLQEKLQAGDKAETDEGQLMAVLSLDEKPGIQAIGKEETHAFLPDLPPVPGKHPSNGRDYEYKRHGTLSLLAGLFFAKMTKTILRGIRVASKAELKARIMAYLQDLNADPVVFRWRYKLEEESVS